jgi:hypothetical protein
MRSSALFSLASFSALALFAASGCSAGGDKNGGTLNDSGTADGITIDGGNFDVRDFDVGEGGHPTGDPQTCDEAVSERSYIGCEYWPTPVTNNVWSIFDFAVVVANAASSTADVTVTGPGGFSTSTKVDPNTLQTVYLPWNSVLKGNDFDSCGSAKPTTTSLRSNGGAYHLTSSVPVTVYQFNPLEYKGQGGAAGKSWASCPGNSPCDDPTSPAFGVTIGCYSVSNDASLLLPTTAMTGNYRVLGQHGFDVGGTTVMGSYVAITATTDGTTVNMKVGPRGHVNAGSGIADTPAGGTLTLSMNAGDVVELMGDPHVSSDMSGSLVTATQPIQIITGIPCIYEPSTAPACDHTEESVFPAETLGQHYYVTVPTGPFGAPVGHDVRIYGNVDGTKLTYAPSPPPGAPLTINAGQVVDVGEVTKDFEVTGDHEFGVGSFMLGASIVDPSTPPPTQQGDPSQSLSTAVEQYRTKYVFLAPNDYEESFVDIVGPAATTITIDGGPAKATPVAISNGFSVWRVRLGTGADGAHVLIASNPVGIQVMGYGSYTSYQYPGGLDLAAIAPPPVK